MDTDDFSEMAYALISRASLISDTLKVELGALSRNYSNEEEWLYGIQEYLRDILVSPDDYVDFWDLEREEGITAARISELALELCEKANDVLSVALNKRGRIKW